MNREKMMEFIVGACMRSRQEYLKSHLSELTPAKILDFMERSITIRDILISMDRIRCDVRALAGSPYVLTIQKVSFGKTIIADWDLWKDDLLLQSEETVANICEMLVF